MFTLFIESSKNYIAMFDTIEQVAKYIYLVGFNKKKIELFDNLKNKYVFRGIAENYLKNFYKKGV